MLAGFKALLRCWPGLEAFERFLLKLLLLLSTFMPYAHIFSLLGFSCFCFGAFGMHIGKALPKTARNDFIWKSLLLHLPKRPKDSSQPGPS